MLVISYLFCVFVLFITRITVAQRCVGGWRPCEKLHFFISLQGGCKWKHDCRAAALDVTGGSPNLFWLALLYASSGYISHAGNYAFWLEMRKFEMWKAHCVGGGAWMNEKTKRATRVFYQASAGFVFSNREAILIVCRILWNQGQVTHIHEWTCRGARCHERSGEVTAAAAEKARCEHQLVLFLNTWLSFSACLRMEGN